MRGAARASVRATPKTWEACTMTPADPVTVVLLGEPVAWARTRISKNGSLSTPCDSATMPQCSGSQRRRR